jgi:polysaccharide biosynthesis transport protein
MFWHLPSQPTILINMDEEDAPVPQSRTAFATRFSNQLHQYKKLLSRYWWLPLLTFVLSVGIEWFLLKRAPLAFVSAGRMMVSVRITVPNANVYSEEINNFFGTQVALMQSDSVRNRVNDRLLTNSEFHPVPVNIDVTLSPKTSIFNMQAVGADASYTRAYLQATMEEYINLKRDLLTNAASATQFTMQEQLEQMGVELKKSKDDLHNYESSNNVVLLQRDGGNPAAEYLSILNRQLDDDKHELSLLKSQSLDETLERLRAVSAQQNSASNAVPQQNSVSIPRPNPSGNEVSVNNTPYNLGEFEQDYLQTKQQLILSRFRRDELKFLSTNAPEMVELNKKIDQQERLLELYKVQSEEQLKGRQHTLEYQIQDLEDEVKTKGLEALDVSKKLSDYEALKETHQRLQIMYDQMQANLQTLDVNKGLGQESVTILEPAALATPVQPETRKHLIMAGLIGLILGIGILVLINQLDDRPSSFTELEQLFDIPVLGQIPLVKTKDKTTGVPVLQLDDERYPMIEAYRNLRSAFLYKDSLKGQPNDHPKSIVIASASPNEGKSMTAANFAITLAQAGARVLLIDADLRRGALHNHFSAIANPGLAEVLAGQCDWFTAVVQTPIPKLHLLPCGTTPRHSHNLFAATGKFLADIAGHYDYYIFDTAPVMVADDVLSLAPNVDGVLMVIRAGFTSGRIAHAALDLLRMRRVNVMGLVFNAVHPKTGDYYYYRSKEYYPQPTTM